MKRPLNDLLRLDGGVCPRVLVLAAHPDDETVGASGLLQRLTARGVPTAIALLTDGAPADMADGAAHGFATRSEYARARRREYARAMRCLPLTPLLFEIAIVDQAASFFLPAAAEAVQRIVLTWRPTALLTHPYEGGHPDHDAAAFAAHAAVSAIRRPPRLLEFTSYHDAGGAMLTGAFLPAQTDPPWVLSLTGDEQRTKREMIRCFATQAETLAAFSTGEEHFRAAPEYDFRQPPHAGRLHYERHPWGIHGAAWRQRAAAALSVTREGVCA